MLTKKESRDFVDFCISKNNNITKPLDNRYHELTNKQIIKHIDCSLRALQGFDYKADPMFDLDAFALNGLKQKIICLHDKTASPACIEIERYRATRNIVAGFVMNRIRQELVYVVKGLRVSTFNFSDNSCTLYIDNALAEEGFIALQKTKAENITDILYQIVANIVLHTMNSAAKESIVKITIDDCVKKFVQIFADSNYIF